MGLQDKEHELLERSESERKHQVVKPGSVLDRIYTYWVAARGKPYHKRENLCHFFWVIVFFAPLWVLRRGLTKTMRIGKFNLPIALTVLMAICFLGVAVTSPRAIFISAYSVGGFFVSTAIIAGFVGKYFDEEDTNEPLILFYESHPALVPALALVFLPILVVLAAVCIAFVAIAGVVKAAFAGLRKRGVFASLTRFRYTKLAWLTWYRFMVTLMLAITVYNIAIGQYGVASVLAVFACGFIAFNWFASTAKDRERKKIEKLSRAQRENYLRQVNLFEVLLVTDQNFVEFMKNRSGIWDDLEIQDMFDALPESLPRILELFSNDARQLFVRGYEMDLAGAERAAKAFAAKKPNAIKEIAGVTWAYLVYAKKAKACPLIELPEHEEVSPNEHIAA